MRDSEFSLSRDEAEIITRLSSLERLREQARTGGRASTLANVEQLIEAELLILKRLRSRASAGESSGEA